MRLKKYLFSYMRDGVEYGFSIKAVSQKQAEDLMHNCHYDGECYFTTVVDKLKWLDVSLAFLLGALLTTLTFSLGTNP